MSRLEVGGCVMRNPSPAIGILPGHRSSAIVGDAIINGVPASGFGKISSLVGGIVSPAVSASPVWSTECRLKIVTIHGLNLRPFIPRQTAAEVQQAEYLPHPQTDDAATSATSCRG